MSWLTNWDEAAKKPRRAVLAMCVMGAAGGFVIGLLVNHGVGFGIALALGFAVVLGFLGWRTVNDPARPAERCARRQDPWRTGRRGALLMAIPFVGLLVAALVGVPAGSVSVFVGAFAICVVLGVILLQSLRD